MSLSLCLDGLNAERTLLERITRLIYALNASVVGVVVLVAVLLCHLLRVSDGAKVAGYICRVLVVGHGTHHWDYAFFALPRPFLGISVAWLISFVSNLIRIEETDSAGNQAGMLASLKGSAVGINSELRRGAQLSEIR